MLLKMSKPADPADQYMENIILQTFKLQSSFNAILSKPIQDRVAATMTASRCIVRFLIHFVKGISVGAGMYATDYLLVNGHFRRMLDALVLFFTGAPQSNDLVITQSVEL